MSDNLMKSAAPAGIPAHVVRNDEISEIDFSITKDENNQTVFNMTGVPVRPTPAKGIENLVNLATISSPNKDKTKYYGAYINRVVDLGDGPLNIQVKLEVTGWVMDPVTENDPDPSVRADVTNPGDLDEEGEKQLNSPSVDGAEPAAQSGS